MTVSSLTRMARRKTTQMKELDTEPLDLLPTCFYPRQLFDQKAQEVGICPKLVVEMNSIEEILAAIRNSTRATVLPSLALSKKAARLRAIRQTEPTPRRIAGLLWRRDCGRCKASRVFMDYAHAVVDEYATNFLPKQSHDLALQALVQICKLLKTTARHRSRSDYRERAVESITGIGVSWRALRNCNQPTLVSPVDSCYKNNLSFG